MGRAMTGRPARPLPEAGAAGRAGWDIAGRDIAGRDIAGWDIAGAWQTGRGLCIERFRRGIPDRRDMRGGMRHG